MTSRRPSRAFHGATRATSCRLPLSVCRTRFARASERLRVTGLEAENARRQRLELENRLKAAPRADTDAAIAAVEQGKNPPPATAPAIGVELETARQRENAANAIVRRAEVALEKAIRVNSGPWLAAQREAHQARIDDVTAALNTVETALYALHQSIGIVHALQRRENGAIERGRRFKTREYFSKALEELRAEVAGATPRPCRPRPSSRRGVSTSGSSVGSPRPAPG